MSLLQRRMTICFAVVAGIAVVRGVLWHRYLSGYVEALARVERSHDALTGFETILSMLTGAETAVRAYLITGRPEQLESYHAARVRLERERGRLSAELSRSAS